MASILSNKALNLVDSLQTWKLVVTCDGAIRQGAVSLLMSNSYI